MVCSVTILAALVAAILYYCFAERLIRAMYYGESWSILNDLIRYQQKKPVEHYINLSDRVFYEIWFLSGIAFPFIILLKEFIFSRRKQKVPQVCVGRATMDQAIDSKISVSQIMIILGISFGVRVIFLPWVSDLPLASDENYYWSVAKLLGRGEFASTILRPPLWGYALAIPSFLYDHVFSGRIFSTIFGTCTPVLVYLLTIRIFNRRTGFIAALIYAVYPEHVCYSHYLWSELIFGMLLLSAVYFFFLFVEDKQKTRSLFISFFMVGISLLSKEFAVIVFAGLMVTLLSLRTQNLLKKALLGCFLFILPVLIYSLIISHVTNRVVILCDAPIGNLRAATGLDSQMTQLSECRKGAITGYLSELKQKKPLQLLRNLRKQFFNLWSPNSFPIVRLLGEHKPESWSYNISRPWPWVCIIAGCYIFVVLTGLTGICLDENRPFKIFSIVCLVGLFMIGVLAFLCSRFRLPFTFIFVIYSAHLLQNWKKLIGHPDNLIRIFFLLIFLRIFVHIVQTKIFTFGVWG
ncbi:MAG: glycosyltransferase family 39 protein [Sedimentisphaerales bacterium]|nr:glycosyltransferase family 39 protein [Sedimentisphaerales bacterium]